MSNIEVIRKEYDELLKKLSDPELVSDWEKFNDLSKRKNFLEKIIQKSEELSEIKKQIKENESILSSQEGPELVSLAEEELESLNEKQIAIEKELEKLMAGKKKSAPESIIIEIRAGTGGEEAALFAADLFRMYSRYAEGQSWKQKILDSHPTSLNGFKEIIFELEGRDVWSKLQYEGGVHRIQRVPITEKSGRIHTSTASVAVLPKPKKAEIMIKPSDLKIETFRASGPGGQYVQKTESAVRITHLPSGLVVSSQNERNQLRNKENAMKILGARLLERRDTAETEKIHGKRVAQIKKAKRAEKIRTYNFPQDRVTDHRTQKSWYNIEEIMDGKLDTIIKVLQS